MIIKNKNLVRKIVTAFLVGLALAPTLSISIASADENKNLFTNSFNQKKGKLIVDGKPELVGLPKDLDLGKNGSYVYFTMERTEYLQGHKIDEDDPRKPWNDARKVKYYFLAVSTSPLYVRTQGSEEKRRDRFIFSGVERYDVELSDNVAMNGTDDLFDLKHLNRKILFLGTDQGESVHASKSGFVELSEYDKDKIVANVYKGDYYQYNTGTGRNYYTSVGVFNYVRNGAISGNQLPFFFSNDFTVKPKILQAGGSVKYVDGMLREISGGDKILASPEAIKNQMVVTPEVEKVLDREAALKDKNEAEIADYEKKNNVEFKKDKDGSYEKDKEGMPVLVDKKNENEKKNEYKGLFEWLIFDADIANKQTKRMMSTFGLDVPTSNVVGDGANALSYNPIINEAFDMSGGTNITGNNAYTSSGNWLENAKGDIGSVLKPIYYSIFIIYCWRRSRTMFD